MNKILAILYILCFGIFNTIAQDKIKVSGTVYDPLKPGALHSVMVVNKSTGLGKFGNPDGSFDVVCNKTDSIFISATGYKILKVCFKDSLPKNEYNLTLKLSEITYQLKQVTIIPERDLHEIKSDIDKLGYREKDYMLSGIDAFQSPITFLYQTFNKHAQKERLAIELENEFRRKQLLKELFAKYVKHDIIDLKDEDFDRFIDFSQITDEQMKRMSQYDFIIYVKEKYRLFQILENEDYYYDKK